MKNLLFLLAGMLICSIDLIVEFIVKKWRNK
jgi:hypothetical protein